MPTHPRTAFASDCNAAHFNGAGVDLCWQSELPHSIGIRGKRRGRNYGAALTSLFGGAWTFVTGPGGPGQWHGDNLTPEAIVDLGEYLDATIVCYLYAGHTVDNLPSHFLACPVYTNTGGFYSTPIGD